jgi:hypothetical protein
MRTFRRFCHTSTVAAGEGQAEDPPPYSQPTLHSLCRRARGPPVPVSRRHQLAGTLSVQPTSGPEGIPAMPHQRPAALPPASSRPGVTPLPAQGPAAPRSLTAGSLAGTPVLRPRACRPCSSWPQAGIPRWPVRAPLAPDPQGVLAWRPLTSARPRGSRSQDVRQGTEPTPPLALARPLPVPAGPGRRPGPGLTPPLTSARAQVAEVPVQLAGSRRRCPLRHPRRLPVPSFVCRSAGPPERQQLFRHFFEELSGTHVSAGRSSAAAQGSCCRSAGAVRWNT